MKIDTGKIILKQIGNLLILLGLVVAIPALVALIYKEWYSALGFLISGFLISGLGFLLYWTLRSAIEPQYNHALVVAASGWLGITLMGGLPLLIIAYITPIPVMNQFIPNDASYAFSSLMYFRNPLHCFFESMSAYTTTGLTMALHEPSVGKGVLFYRSFAQWVGGAGFIVMVLAVFKQISGRGAILLYGSESTGERLTPKVIETARVIWKTYLYVTVFSIVYLIVGTRLILPHYALADNIFDSVNHAMCGQSTGGFSTLDDSIAGYHSPAMEILYLLPMIIGSFSLPFYYKVIFKKSFKEIWSDIQTRWLIIAFLFGGLIQGLLLSHTKVVPALMREGIFQFVSAMSTTGWQTSNMATWDRLSVLFIVAIGMFIGGASGGTVGGIKMIRALFIQKVLRWQISKVFLSKNTVKILRFDNRRLHEDEINEEFAKAITIAVLFFLLIIVSTILSTLILPGTTSFSDALIESASAQCTVGLSSGITDPSMSPLVELIYIFQMWTGRLEIIPVFALVRALFIGTKPILM